MNRAELRSAALDIFQHVMRAVDARVAVRRAISIDEKTFRVFKDEFKLAGRPIYVVGAGKAALSMSLGLNDVLGDRIERGVISTTHAATNESLPTSHAVFYGGHPLPNQESLRAAEAAFELLNEANQKRAFVIFLISGGASAMIERPISDDITLEDLQVANRQLITCGATIAEINSVRRCFSAVKGGGLATPLSDTEFITFIISDTNDGDESSVGSGPTLPADVDAPEPLQVLESHGLIRTLPPSILQAIREYKKVDARRAFSPFYILLDNSVALDAAAERAAQMDLWTQFASDIVEQPIDEGAVQLVNRALEAKVPGSVLISGGEFSCAVSGNGRGGRNLETVLRSAIRLSEVEPTTPTVVLSAGTDGIDGSSFAAGAIADEMTVSRARELEMDPNDFLARSDSHAFFEALGDLIVTGPTGTNVRDLRIVLTA